MADYPDGTQATTATIEADTTGLALDEHIYNSDDNLSAYDHLKEIRTQIDSYLKNLDITLSTLNTSINNLNQLYEQITDVDESTAQSITLDTKGHGLVISIYATATTATTFTVDVSNDNNYWINVYTSSSAENTYSNSLPDAFKGFRYVRLRNVAAGTSGQDTVTLIISAK